MLQQFIEYEQALQRTEVLTLRSVDGFSIACRQGDLWVTEDNGGDVLLRSGESHVVHPHRLVVVEALNDARLQLAAPPQRHPRLTSVVEGLRQTVRRLTAPRHAECR